VRHSSSLNAAGTPYAAPSTSAIIETLRPANSTALEGIVIKAKLLGVVAALALLTVITAARAIAEERVDICAQYSATGASYHVNAISTTGTELNQATHSFNYNTLSHYIVIFWAQNQATVIEMAGIFSSPTYIQSSGTDQEGRSWEITAYSPVSCFP
jgi:hypothetical protein